MFRLSETMSWSTLGWIKRYRLIGSTASPYAIKLRALLRYRRIPFDWVIMTRALRKQTGHLRPNLIPVPERCGSRPGTCVRT